MSAPTLPPGQRWLHGKAYTYDMDLLGLHEAHERVIAAPALLDHLTYDELSVLVTSCLTVLGCHGHLPQCLPYPLDLTTTKLLHKRACEERALRPEHRAFGGSGVSKREAA